MLKVQRIYNKKSMILRQEMYSNAPLPTSTWWIPYNYATAGDPNFNDTRPNGWVSHNEKYKIIHDTSNSNEWVIFNKQQTSFYRVLYDDTNYKLIVKQLKSENYEIVHEFSRSQIIDDLNQFVATDRVNITILFDVLSYLQREIEYAPWVSAQRAILHLNRYLPGIKYYDQFRIFIRNLTETFFIMHGLDDLPHDSLLQKNSREIAVNLACGFGSKNCLFGTHMKFKAALEKNIELPPNTKSIILQNGIRKATAKELDILWKFFLETNDLNDRNIISISFGNIEDPILLQNFLERTLNKYQNDLNDSWRLKFFRSTAQSSQYGLKLCIQLLNDHSAEIMENYHLDLNGFQDVILELSKLVVTKEIKKEVRVEQIYIF